MKTFPKGGVHPPENKMASTAPIQILPLPAVVNIPVVQHLGAPAETVVAKNDLVKTGQLIARSDGFVSSNIHSSVSGKVLKIDQLPDSSGYRQTMVSIEVNGDEWMESIDRSDNLITEISASREEIIAKTLEMGIVGLGGATFPSHVKLSVPRGKKAEVLILNGVECEPFLTSDHRLMLEKGEEILVGTRLLMKALDAGKAFIGIEVNKPDAIEHLKTAASRHKDIEVIPLKVRYPQGGEKQLIKAVTGREVPSGGLPIDVGTVVHNVGTTFAVYEAVQKNKPLFERVVTVTGKKVKNPGNYMVRIGTPVSDLIEASGGVPDGNGKIINGGPMMGKALSSTDIPVTKGTSGIVLVPAEESRRKKIQNCIRCGKCLTVCPMGLEPYLLMTLSELSRWDDVELNKAADCIECGSCSYACPASRPLLDYIRLGKSTVLKIIRSRNK